MSDCSRRMMGKLRNFVSWLMVATSPAFALVAPASAESGPIPAPVGLEILVKFTDSSDAHRRVKRSLDEYPQNLSTLAAVGDRLHRSTGFVLIPERVTSGAEIIVRVSERSLLETVMKTVSERQEVSSLELVELQRRNPYLPRSQLLLRFRETGDESNLLARAYTDQTYAGRVQTLTTNLCAASGVPVLGSPETGAALAVTVDRIALMEMLVPRLNELDYVDYAQPNSNVQIMK